LSLIQKRTLAHLHHVSHLQLAKQQQYIKKKQLMT